MRTILVAATMMLLPSGAFAALDCTLTEYEDHLEAVCVGDTPPQTLAAKTEQEQAVEQEEALTAVGVHEQEGDEFQVRVVRNVLGRLHATQVARSRQR